MRIPTSASKSNPRATAPASAVLVVRTFFNGLRIVKA